MIENSPRSRHLALAIVAISVLIGGWLRLSGLDAKSISHPEMYVPGIRLPQGVAEPAERLTLGSVLTGTFSSDTHPPGYYIAMLPWTHAFGTSLGSMRLPSALLGLACIPLLYCLGVFMDRPVSGALAAALLALSGYHVFWTRVARMFALECLLGLAATAVLLWIGRARRAPSFLMAVYIVLVLAGVATDVYFWSLLAVQMVWVLGDAWGKRELTTLCHAQILAVVLGSPLIAFAAYQSGNTVADLSRNVPRYLVEFSGFAFAFPSDASGFFPSAVPLTGSVIGWTLRSLVLLFAIVLLISGFRDAWRSSQSTGGLNVSPSAAGLWRWGWITAGLVGTLEICAFIYATRWLSPDQLHPTIRATKALAVLPIALAILALFADRYWSRLPPPGDWKRLVEGKLALAALLAIVPFALLALASQARPLLNQRGMLFASPYLFFILARGLLALRRTAWIIATAFVLVPICALSLISYGTMTVDPVDYGHFAASLVSEIRSSDLVFVQKGWSQTPILYYLNPDQYRIIGRDYRASSFENPGARVWVVLLYDSAPSAEMRDALSGYDQVRTITGPRSQALLYEHSVTKITLKRPENTKRLESIGN